MKPMTVAVTALAGVALFEAALVPGVLIGGAAVLAPRIFRRYFGKARRSQAREAARARNPGLALPAPSPEVKRAIFKTITFRTITTSLDFTSNILVIGDLAAAAGLSAYGLIAGPLFFFAHEMLWGRMGPGGEQIALRVPAGVQPPLEMKGEFKLNRALIKTVTYRALATTADFSANLYVTRDIASATGLTAFGFIVGPFVYYYHEKAWDRYSPEPPARA